MPTKKDRTKYQAEYFQSLKTDIARYKERKQKSNKWGKSDKGKEYKNEWQRKKRALKNK